MGRGLKSFSLMYSTVTYHQYTQCIYNCCEYNIAALDIEFKDMFCKTRIDFSSILQCNGTETKNSSHSHCADLRIVTVYVVKELENGYSFFR